MTVINCQDILQHFEGVRAQGKGKWIALCPAHNDKNPSLSIASNGERILLHCFSGCDIGDIVRAAGLEMGALFSKHETEYQYLDRNGEYQFSVVRIEETGKPKTFRQKTKQGWGLNGTVPLLYNLPNVSKAITEEETVYIVEGEKDADRLNREGLCATTAPMGAGKWRDSYADDLTWAKVVIIPDNDSVGREHANMIAKSLDGKVKSIKTVSLPSLPDKGDVSDWLDAGNTVESLLSIVQKNQIETYSALKPKPSLFVTPEAILATPRDASEDGMGKGLSTGWESLDKHLTLLKGALYVATGIPSHGKGSFTRAMIVNSAKRHNWHWAIFAPEDFPLGYIRNEFSQIIAGKSISLQPKMTSEEYFESLHFINKHISIFDTTNNSMTLDQMLDAVKQLNDIQKVDGLIIDPANELQTDRPQSQTETDWIGECLIKCRRFAQSHDICFWIVAHPKKMQKLNNGNYPVPDLYDISGSQHWNNKPMFGLTVWRDFEKGHTDIHVKKVRFRYYGFPGVTRLYFDPLSGRYSDKPIRGILA